eukprot:comp20826_c0_seq1/m.27481 comp20826_c0_seq1/g.27481  ORF comp20826_c0_seq1/g.27481 comp20826_c0_seq1/m.27481 type:complete len:260 (-) comp20826_c0_seq1:681-1460(-)
MLKLVRVPSDVLLVCLTHALSTDKEEIMGLLIGDIKQDGNDYVTNVQSIFIMARNDRAKDRVEVSPAQLSEAATYAEQLSHELRRQVQVVGWYHSHPHITVLPSAVDLRTQAGYQTMDSCFVGLIFSCFTGTERNKTEERVQVTAFQALQVGSTYERQEVAMEVVSEGLLLASNLKALVSLAELMLAEEQQAHRQSINDREVSVMEAIHSGAIYTKALCQLMEVLAGPLLQQLQARIESNKEQLNSMRAETEMLLKGAY